MIKHYVIIIWSLSLLGGFVTGKSLFADTHKPTVEESL